MKKRDTVSRVYEGEALATMIVAELVRESCWFELNPLPHDCWEVRVKSDRVRSLPDSNRVALLSKANVILNKVKGKVGKDPFSQTTIATALAVCDAVLKGAERGFDADYALDNVDNYISQSTFEDIKR